MKKHSGRAHSKFSASGAERWFECPGSVALSETLPERVTEASKEGTACHEVLERILRGRAFHDLAPSSEMIFHARNAANYIFEQWQRRGKRGAELQVETRVPLTFIHPQAFGTLDSAIIEHFGLLNILDFKYGTHLVSPKENLQLIFYALGVAYQYEWNFSRVRLTVIQPRARKYDGPSFWELGILELKGYARLFKSAVNRVEREPDTYNEGPWCFFCKAKQICPLKQEAKVEKAKSAFLNSPLK